MRTSDRLPRPLSALEVTEQVFVTTSAPSGDAAVVAPRAQLLLKPAVGLVAAAKGDDGAKCHEIKILVPCQV